MGSNAAPRSLSLPVKKFKSHSIGTEGGEREATWEVLWDVNLVPRKSSLTLVHGLLSHVAQGSQVLQLYPILGIEAIPT